MTAADILTDLHSYTAYTTVSLVIRGQKTFTAESIPDAHRLADQQTAMVLAEIAEDFDLRSHFGGLHPGTVKIVTEVLIARVEP